MKASDVRDKYIKFFEAKPRNHNNISAAQLVPEGDPSTLFTSSGMQQLVPYLMGKLHPEGKRLVDSQPCIRTIDIDLVGDRNHLTYFEMLGNWSLGDYFKKEQLPWIWEFFTKELGLPKERLWVSISNGGKGIKKDEESFEVWKKIGIPEKRICSYNIEEENWWSRSGPPDEMPPGEIGGPDSEVFLEFPRVRHNPKYGKECHPNCNCGRFLEIGNSVFIQYEKQKDGSLELLSQKNVDFGGGLERILAAVMDTPDIFETELFQGAIKNIESFSGVGYGESKSTNESMRIVSDHLRAASCLAAEGVQPSNKMQGYVLRRLIRRSVFRLVDLGFEIESGAISTFARPFTNNIEIVRENWPIVKDVLNIEAVRFSKAVSKGMRKLERYLENNDRVDGKFTFDLYQNDGFPLELTLDILKKKGIGFSRKEKKGFETEFEKHKELSKTASVGMFKGGLADKSVETTKLHTTAHLLQASLRKVLGESVEQKGQNITSERLRFDFSHPQKLTEDEIIKVEKLMNKQIKNDLSVTYEVKTIKEALDEGALAFFREKYDEKVNIYTISDPDGNWFSKEVCGGPHVNHTSEIGRVKIKKQDKLGAGTVRIYVVLEMNNKS